MCVNLLILQENGLACFHFWVGQVVMGCKVFDGHGEWRTLAGSMFVWCKRRIQKRVVKMKNNGVRIFFNQKMYLMGLQSYFGM